MAVQAVKTDARAVNGALLTVFLCFLVAVLEGFDIQAMGVAAPKLGPALKLDKATLGQALSASNIGLVVGAALGGWLADRFGRKPVLIGAVLMFGVFTLGTMVAQTYEQMFAVRLLTGFATTARPTTTRAMPHQRRVEISSPSNIQQQRGTRTSTTLESGNAIVRGIYLRT